MSTAQENNELAQLIALLTPEARLSFSVMALLSYEYLITFGQEVALFWMRKKTSATWLFFAVRYLALFVNVIFVGTTDSPMSDSRCYAIQKGMFAVGIFQYPVWAAFASLRTLALTNMNWPLASAVFALACGPFAVNMWALHSFGVGGGNIPTLGCASDDNSTPQDALIAVCVSRSCAIAADIIVLAVTLRYTITSGRARGLVFSAPSLAKVLVVDGVIYFLALFTLNFLQLLLTLLSMVDPLFNDSDVSVYADPLSAILICRFLMNLQYSNQRALNPALDDTEAGDGNMAGTLRFASRIVGSIGGSLAVGQGTDLTEDGDEGEEGITEGVHAGPPKAAADTGGFEADNRRRIEA